MWCEPSKLQSSNERNNFKMVATGPYHVVYKSQYFEVLTTNNEFYSTISQVWKIGLPKWHILQIYGDFQFNLISMLEEFKTTRFGLK